MPERLSRIEFIALMAMLYSIIAFSIDSILPALPEIGAELTPRDLNRAQLVLTVFVLGMGIGTFFTGPLSDAFGRRPVLLAGVALYIAGALAGWLAGSLETLLVARFVQGLGVAGPRVVAMAIIRDLFAGREMAKLISLVMLIFTLVPAIAPSLGAVLIGFVGWRGVFLTFVVFAVAASLWLYLRQAETLPREDRRPLRLHELRAAIVEVFSIPMVRLSILVQGLCSGILFSVLSSTQQVFDKTFDQGENFPLWFGGIALMAATASILNAVVVVRLGMRYLVTLALGGQIALSAVMLALAYTSGVTLPLWVLWNTYAFFMVGLTLGNLNALAMEPLGHIAGFAASIISSVSTVMAVAIAIPVGLAFDGTPGPLLLGSLICAMLGFALIRRMARLERVTQAVPRG